MEGRRQSIVRGAGGRYVPSSFFFQCFEDFDHTIRRFQVVENAPGAIVLRVVKGGRFSDEALGEVLARLREGLGHDARIEVELVREGAIHGDAVIVRMG